IDKVIWIGGRDSKRRVERAIQPYQRRIRASTLARDDIGCALVLSREPNLLDVDYDARSAAAEIQTIGQARAIECVERARHERQRGVDLTDIQRALSVPHCI